MRREFSTALRIEMIRRAMNAAGDVICEGCGLNLRGKRVEFDHIIPEAMRLPHEMAKPPHGGRWPGSRARLLPPSTGWENSHRHGGHRQGQEARGRSSRHPPQDPGRRLPQGCAAAARKLCARQAPSTPEARMIRRALLKAAQAFAFLAYMAAVASPFMMFGG